MNEACRICGSTNLGPPVPTREMLHGTRTPFSYRECGDCACVQIGTIPDDLAPWYPQGYFSFRPLSALDRNPVRRWIDPRRVAHAFGAGGVVGALAEAVSRPFAYVEWVRECGLGPDARVLDVGCGAGKTLLNFALGGFPEPVGLDPFLAAPISYRSGAKVLQLSIERYAESAPAPFDLIMFHHSLEHMIDPFSALRAARSLLSERGRILIFIPVADCWAWRHYQGDWMNLDPPRHLHLLSRGSASVLARETGLELLDWRSAGALSQFTGSERYRRDIPDNDPRSDVSLFGRDQLARWQDEVASLNLNGDGDQARLILAAA
jgi:SAM-dependent methyltransferase